MGLGPQDDLATGEINELAINFPEIVRYTLALGGQGRHGVVGP